MHCEAQINGSPAAVGWDSSVSPQFNDRASLLKPGRNTLTFWC